MSFDGSYFRVYLQPGRLEVNRLAACSQAPHLLHPSIIENNPKKVFNKINEVFGELMTKETMYFYLVDELTGQPVRGDGYPIVITTPSELVPKLLPVMQVGMRAMSLYNGVVGVAQMIGYPAPKVPEAWRKGAQSSVEMLKQVCI